VNPLKNHYPTQDESMLLLIVDFETTGTNPNHDRPLELGAILYSVEDHTSIAQIATLIPSPTNPVESINHIKPIATQKVSRTYKQALKLFSAYAEVCDYLIAHNSDFDSQWLGKYEIPCSNKPWLCTAKDFEWSKIKQKRVSLKRLAYSYGVIMPQQHRALSDSQVIASIFDRVKSLEEMIQHAIIRHQNRLLEVRDFSELR
jgi:DNA polymerase-3 subunit epsilon